ncbi:fluoride efflux transporter FluC [Parvularcula lutaonensis]|uniref:Fluoride-specific ion channel FluC n=1 Tax=Parvularcula lutaonensis TaxID=491923 RepID=A0ABV7M9R4_9PROT|nr:CrcB family protein [Parvularcula lutaonensis]GGY42929.1 putative fluoride ion transporter CrcB [Parvularcula lutaonensis]
MTQFPMTLLAAAAGGALGASLRYAFLYFVQGGALGILCLNVGGSLALGFLFASGEGRSEFWTIFFGAGLLGALTTFSTFSADAVRLFVANPVQSALYIAASVVLAITAFVIGLMLARAL